MATNPINTAFPFARNEEDFELGLTKREYFAAMALQGLLTNVEEIPPNTDPTKYLSEIAVAYADGLIEALNKEKE